MQDFRFKETKKYDKKPGQNPYRNYNKKDYGYDEVVGVGTWIGLSLILGIIGAIPVIGPFIVIVILLIMSFNKDINLNLRNWARAALIMMVIVLILSLLLFGTFYLKMFW